MADPDPQLHPTACCGLPQRLPLSFCSLGVAPMLSSPQDPLLLLMQGRGVQGQANTGELGLAVAMDRQSLRSASMQAHCFHQAGTKFAFLTNLQALRVPAQGPSFKKWLASPPALSTPTPSSLSTTLSSPSSWYIWDRPWAVSYCLQNAKLAAGIMSLYRISHT